MKDLKPVNCGCGGEANVHATRIGWEVWCKNCQIATQYYPTEAEAVKAWNKAMGERVVKVRSHGVGTAWSVCECGQGVNLGWSYCPFCGGRIERK